MEYSRQFVFLGNRDDWLLYCSPPTKIHSVKDLGLIKLDIIQNLEKNLSLVRSNAGSFIYSSVRFKDLRVRTNVIVEYIIT